MTNLAVRNLIELLDALPRRCEGARLLCDGVSLELWAHPDPGSRAASTEVCGPFLGTWDMTAYRASVQTIRAWLRMCDADAVVDISPFWFDRSNPQIVITGGGQQFAFPLIACPSMPSA